MKKLVHLHSLKLDEKTKMSKKQFRDFKSSREFVRSLKLKKVVEWQEYCRNNQLPSDIPLRSDYVYKNKGWIGWGDFLGTGNISSKDMEFRNFESAREFARLLKLKSYEEWNEYCKSGDKPEDIPSHPQGTYKNKGWIGWGDFLGTGNVHKKEFRDFESAREFVRELNIEGNNEWREYCKSGNKPEDIPSAPELTYKNNGWIGYGDWLGTGRVANFNLVFHDFESARDFVRKLGIKSKSEWEEYCKSGNKPDDIPSDPSVIYKNKGWIGYGDWLGTGRVATQDREYLPFADAKKFVRTLELKNLEDWKNYCKSGNKPEDIPSAPELTYKNKGWIGYGDWLGTGNISTIDLSKQYLSFSEAREEARRLAKKYNIKNWKDWQNAIKKGLIPKNIPSNPNNTYGKKRKKNG